MHYNILIRPLTMVLMAFLAVVVAVSATDALDGDPEFNKRRTLSLGIIIFPGFEPLDVFGPLEMFFLTSSVYKVTLSLISDTIGPVSAGPPPHRITTLSNTTTTTTSHDNTHNPPSLRRDDSTQHPHSPSLRMMDMSYMIRPTLHSTHTFLTAPALDVLLVPGGIGTRTIGAVNGGSTAIETFIQNRYDQLDYLLSVCTGSLILARSGVLRGKKATTNKGAWGEVMGEVGAGKGSGIEWVPTARWVVDGKVWTSSGVSAGMDMTYAFLSHLYGKDNENITRIMNAIEYLPHTDPHWDPYSVVWKVPGADPKANVTDCVKPAGF